MPYYQQNDNTRFINGSENKFVSDYAGGITLGAGPGGGGGMPNGIGGGGG